MSAINRFLKELGLSRETDRAAEKQLHLFGPWSALWSNAVDEQVKVKSSSAGEMKLKVDDFIFTCADRQTKQEILLNLSKSAMARLRNAFPQLMKSKSIITTLDKQPRQEMRLGDKDLSSLLPALRISLSGFDYIIFIKIGKGEFLPLLVRWLPGVPYQMDIITGMSPDSIDRLIAIAKNERRSNARHLVCAVLNHYARSRRARLGNQPLRGRPFIETVPITHKLLERKGLYSAAAIYLMRCLERLSMKGDRRKGYMVLDRELVEPAFIAVSVSAYVRMPGPDSPWLVLVKPNKPGFIAIPVYIRIRGRHTIESSIAEITPRQALEISRTPGISDADAKILKAFAEQLREKDQNSSSAGVEIVVRREYPGDAAAAPVRLQLEQRGLEAISQSA